MRIYLGADHAGFELKEKIKKYLIDKNLIVEDFSEKLDLNDNYPDYAFLVGEKVVRDKNSRGILICGTGTGMCLAVNKVKGVRGAFAYDKYSAVMSRRDNDSNVLCLRGKKFSDKLALEIVKVWLQEKFSNASRHIKRINLIKRYEQRK